MDDFFRNMRSFLGLPKFGDPQSSYQEPENKSDPRSSEGSRYDAFSDALEMHRYFEKQIHKIFSEFDIFQFGGNDSFFGDFPGHGEIEFFDRNDESLPIGDQYPGELRDQFLKPGFERASQKHGTDKTDRELKENEINLNDLDSIVSADYFKNKQEHPNVTTRIFGKSISTKTIMNADGSIEIHKTVHDNQGNKETTITRRIGDKEHTLIKKKDSSGKEEVIENFVNLDDKEASKFSLLPETKPWSLYDKFFK